MGNSQVGEKNHTAKPIYKPTNATNPYPNVNQSSDFFSPIRLFPICL